MYQKKFYFCQSAAKNIRIARYRIITFYVSFLLRGMAQSNKHPITRLYFVFSRISLLQQKKYHKKNLNH